MESLDTILSNYRISKALIRLRECAGWSAPWLFANHRRQVFSRRGPYDSRFDCWHCCILPEINCRTKVLTQIRLLHIVQSGEDPYWKVICSVYKIMQQTTSANACADPESYVRGGPTLTLFFTLEKLDEGSKNLNTPFSGPSTARLRNPI